MTRPQPLTNTDLISPEWLNQNLNNSDLVILDASLPKPKSNPGDNPLNGTQIPGARFFDIENVFSDNDSELPHTMLSESEFESRARELGINQSSFLVVYDNLGVYSSPRAWWMFRAMGHENIAILDGGLPAWIEAGLTVENKNALIPTIGDFIGRSRREFWKSSKNVLDSIETVDTITVDARSNGRFIGSELEPRIGLRSGHIPNSINIHFESVLDGIYMRSKSELKHLFKENGIVDQAIIFTCGSGLTACIVAFAAHLTGIKKLSVYDGSWSEWGQPGELPVVS